MTRHPPFLTSSSSVNYLSVLTSNHSQDFLCSKVIDNTPDQEEEEYQSSNKKTNIIIADTDYDWFDPNELFGDDDDEDEEDEIPAPGESKAQL
jgi:hypothetical protein